MKACDRHWKMLRAALDERGLSPQVPSTGEQAAQRLVDGRPDPLMAAYMAIVQNAMDAAGLEVMANENDGTERCPLCFLSRECKAGRRPGGDCGTPDCYDRWIEFAANDVAQSHALGSA